MAYEPNIYPVSKFRFVVECNGISSFFSEVTGFDASVESTEYREGGRKTTTLKLAGLRKYGNITLKRAVSAANSDELWKWWCIAEEKEAQRQDLTINLLDNNGAVAATWSVENAFPVKYTAPDFDAKSSDAAIETIELAHEGMKRIK